LWDEANQKMIFENIKRSWCATLLKKPAFIHRLFPSHAKPVGKEPGTSKESRTELLAVAVLYPNPTITNQMTRFNFIRFLFILRSEGPKTITALRFSFEQGIFIMSQMIITTVGGLSRVIRHQPRLSTLQFQCHKEEKITVGGVAEFAIHFNGRKYSSDKFDLVDLQEHQDETQRRITVHLHHEEMDVVCVYHASSDKPYLKKWLEVTFHRPGIVDWISVESLNIPTNTLYKVAKSSGGFDLALFLSAKSCGLFFTLDFP